VIRPGWQNSVWRLPVLSGLLLVFAYLPFGLLVPNFVAFFPILYWLDCNPNASVRRRMRAGLVFGLTTNAILLHWMYAMLAVSWMAITLYVFLVSMFALFAMVAVALMGWIRARTRWSFALVLPGSWLTLEWARSWGDLRMTADHMGHTLGGYPFLIQFADLGGPYGVGAFMLVVNALIYETWRRRRQQQQGNGSWRRPAMVLAALLVVVLGYDTWKWTHPPKADGYLRTAYVQPNIPLDVKDDLGTADEQWEVLVRLTEQATSENPDLDLIVWPESAYPRPLYHWLDHPGTFVVADLQRLAREIGVTILAGIEYYRVRAEGDYDLYNAAVVAHPDGTLDPVWTAKVYLVPFTEGLPFDSILGPVLSDLPGDLGWMSGGFLPGPSATSLPVGEHLVGVMVCYEDFFANLAREMRNEGAHIQAIITNDAWFGRTVFQAYQANTVRMRAIENRTAFIRSANTGISGFVDPLGRYQDWSEMFVEAVAARDLPLTSIRTVYDRVGDVVAWVAIAGLAIMIVAAGRKTRGGEA
jgi:apolipoprotein N-acyltransferase